MSNRTYKHAGGRKYTGKHGQKHHHNKDIPFLSNMDEMQAMKTDLQFLMTDFKQGKLQAFGKDGTVKQMDQIRNFQRSLARLHFDLDGQIDYGSEDSTKIREQQNSNMTSLMKDLEGLGEAMLALNASDSPASTSTSMTRNWSKT